MISLRRRATATTDARAADVQELRARLRAVGRGTPALRRTASRMRALRAAIAAELDGVSSCAGCTRGCSAPQGVYDGGHCCSGDTFDVFNADELAALALAGTRSRRLQVLRDPAAGCAFRGPRGCTLGAVDRPNVCAMYMCRDLRHELFDRDRLDRVEALADELGASFEQFAALRAEHALQEELAAIHPGLVAD